MRFFSNFFSNRRYVLLMVSAILASLIFGRLFVLQIVRGEGYQNNYRLKVERQEVIEATRGNICDRNGQLLAYNKLANAVTIEDIGSYKNDAEKNEVINGNLSEVITALEKNGDTIYTDFGIYMDSGGNYYFRDEGTRLMRFRADIFGHSDIADLKYNKKLGIAEDIATADEIMDYLCDVRYMISPKLPKELRYKIALIRYRLGLNTYQKYISTTIATDVSQSSVAYIMENKYRFTGIGIEEKSIRVYDEAPVFSNIIGYTGTISPEEYDEMIKTDKSYTLNDIVGKAGIEQVMNGNLMGKKGYQTVYVDSLGNLLETADITLQKSGDDVYLSVDKDLTVKTYNLLEQQIAGILYSKIVNIKEYDSEHASSRDDILIPIYDVYYALVENRLIDINKTVNLTDAESNVFNAFSIKFNEVINNFSSVLKSSVPTIYRDLPPEYQAYSTYLVRKLKSEGIFDSSKIDDGDENQILWTNEKMAVSDYIKYVIEKGWIDIESFVTENEYVDTSEVYERLIDHVISLLENDSAFKRLVYKYAILEDRINIGALCAILYDQGVIEMNEESRLALLSGQLNTFNFIKDQIRELKIKPGQLGLDPCQGSCVIMDPRNGDVLAMVSYPGYDSNRLANNLDKDYYSYLNVNKASPLYNHATQEKTAPGSTFKLVSAAAGLGERVVDTETLIEDEGKFTKVSNEPSCWIYPNGTHGLINISEAIRDSCNYFFYEVGYRLAGALNYNDNLGIQKLKAYASMFGLDRKTGVEIEESEPNIATEYPVMAAIGQSNHNFTTISLARYVSAVANTGTVYDLTLLSKVVDKDGNVIKSYSPTENGKITNLSNAEWGAIKSGMRMVAENHWTFKDFPVAVAGKTGTAQASASRPNHALFVGYAPYESPSVAIACRISFGYTSSNAADFAKKILGEYFNVGDYQVDGAAQNVNTNNRITD